jgi:hypothetical protein
MRDSSPLIFRDIETNLCKLRSQVAMDENFVDLIVPLIFIAVVWLSYLCVVVFKVWSGWVKDAKSWRQVRGQSDNQRIGGRLSLHRDLEEGMDLITPPPAYVWSRNRNLEEWTAPPPLRRRRHTS